MASRTTRSQATGKSNPYAGLPVEDLESSTEESVERENSSNTRLTSRPRRTPPSSKRQASEPTKDEDIDGTPSKRIRSQTQNQTPSRICKSKETQTVGSQNPKLNEPLSGSDDDGGFQVVEHNRSVPRDKISVQQFTNKKETFDRGMIIRFPHHAPNMTPTAITEGPELKRTPIGGVVSKMRRAVVIWKFSERMLVIPMYTSTGRGLAARPSSVYGEHVEICNESIRKEFVKVGVHDAIGAQMNSGWTMFQESYLCLAKPISVQYTEDIQTIGKVKSRGKQLLKNHFSVLLAENDVDDVDD